MKKKKNPKKDKLFDRKRINAEGHNNIIKLNIIPEPPLPYTRTVLIKDGNDPLFIKGYTTKFKFVCGKCGSILMEGIDRKQVINIVLKCNKCNSFNDT